MRHPLTTFLVTVVLFWLIALPKGGFKLYELPITWAYMGIALLAAWSAFKFLPRPGAFVEGLLIGIPVLLFPAWMSAIILINGFDSAATTAGALVAFLVMPILLLVFVRPLLAQVPPSRIWAALVIAIRFAVVFGFVIYIFNILFGRYLEIPYITVNIDDVGTLAMKHNDRGVVDKFFSTYNNGNIYGICMCTVMPIYLLMEKRFTFRALFVLTLLLTTSRSTYFGAIVAIAGLAWARGVSFKTILSLGLAGVVGIGAVGGMLTFLGYGAGWLFDANLGGRRAAIEALPPFQFIPEHAWGGWNEMNYISALNGAGWTGLALFCLSMWTPLFWRAPEAPEKRLVSRHLKAGLIAYCAASFFDGAALLAPTMAIYWLVATCVSLYSPRSDAFRRVMA